MLQLLIKRFPSCWKLPGLPHAAGRVPDNCVCCTCKLLSKDKEPLPQAGGRHRVMGVSAIVILDREGKAPLVVHVLGILPALQKCVGWSKCTDLNGCSLQQNMEHAKGRCCTQLKTYIYIVQKIYGYHTMSTMIVDTGMGLPDLEYRKQGWGHKIGTTVQTLGCWQVTRNTGVKEL